MMGGSVVVLGSFMMDLVISAPRRPRSGETVVGTGFDVFLGGKGCNQAVAAARSGARTAMIGRLGADDFGARFLDCLRIEGINASHVTVDEMEGTGIGAPVVEADGENSIVVVPRANHRMTVDALDLAGPTIEAADLLLLQLELPTEVTLAAARRAKAAGTTVILNPAPIAMDVGPFAGLVDVLVPNAGEAAELTGLAGDPPGAAAALRHQFGSSVIVTVGGEGAWIDNGDGPQHLPAHPVDALDTVGAGDAFCGALGARLAYGDGIREAATYATAAAALAVTRRGAEPSMPTVAEVTALLVSTANLAPNGTHPFLNESLTVRGADDR